MGDHSCYVKLQNQCADVKLDLSHKSVKYGYFTSDPPEKLDPESDQLDFVIKDRALTPPVIAIFSKKLEMIPRGTEGFVRYNIIGVGNNKIDNQAYLSITVACPFSDNNRVDVSLHHCEGYFAVYFANIKNSGAYGENQVPSTGSPLEVQIYIKKKQLTNVPKLIWFNGTGESKDQTRHLFFNEEHRVTIVPDRVTIVPGWGTGGAMDGKHNMSSYRAMHAGITEEDEEIFKSYLIARNYSTPSYIQAIKSLKGEETHYDGLNLIEKIREQKSDSLIIGGMSRGAAFFVPYFLKLLLENSDAIKKIKRLMIFLIEPVTGSVDEQDKTETTLTHYNIRTEEQKCENLLKALKEKGIELYGVFLFSGFDRRKKHFHVDLTFLNAFHKGRESGVVEGANYYVGRVGLTHAALSSWSLDPKYKDAFLKSFNYKPKETENDNTAEKVKEMMAKNIDLKITGAIIAQLMKKDDAAMSNLQNDLAYYNDITTEMLNRFDDIYYDYPTYSLEKLLYWGEDNITEVRKGQRVVNVQKAELLSQLLAKWHMQ